MTHTVPTVKNIDIAAFDYNLPDDKIAKYPLAERDSCRLLVAGPTPLYAPDEIVQKAVARLVDLPDVNRVPAHFCPDEAESFFRHTVFGELPDMLPPYTFLVRNNTKVINARLQFFKETGAAIEIFLLDPDEPADYACNFQSTSECSWKCLIGNLKRWKEGRLTAEVELDNGRSVTLHAERLGAAGDNSHTVRFSWDGGAEFGHIIAALGNIPIPPYLNRDSEESDRKDYQTVYADASGSVAAPTAGLHFTDQVFNRIKEPAKRISVNDVTLHVGAGTFRPVKSETLEGHDMHSETFTVTATFMERLVEAVVRDNPVAAVGTTSVRTIESLPYIGQKILRHMSEKSAGEPELHVDQWEAYDDDAWDIDTLKALRAILSYMHLNNLDSLTCSTSIMIAPGFKWRITNLMVTNFHQPQSTLLLLVSSFLGMTLVNLENNPDGCRWKKLYQEALDNGYRFLSYGDACLFFRHAPEDTAAIKMEPSKSISNRLLLLNALSDHMTELKGLSECDDTKALSAIDKAVEESVDREETLRVETGDGAAPLRFGIMMAALTPGASVILSPGQRLKERMAACGRLPFEGTPIEECVTLLDDGSYKVTGRTFLTSADDDNLPDSTEEEMTVIDAEAFRTSQELSALIMGSAKLPPMRIVNLQKCQSVSYLLMTTMVAKAFGIRCRVECDDNSIDTLITTPGTMRAPDEYTVEGDWSSALFFLEFCMMAKAAPERRDINLSISNCDIPDQSIQPDSNAVKWFHKIDYALYRRHTDMPYFPLEEADSTPEEEDILVDTFAFMPDAMPPVTAALSVLQIPFLFPDLDMLRNKESDRLKSMKSELSKLGIKLGSMRGSANLFNVVTGETRFAMPKENALINPHGDHRVAMALAATIPMTRRMRIRNPWCVTKSMPGFWSQLAAFGVECVYDKAHDIMNLRYVWPEQGSAPSRD